MNFKSTLCESGSRGLEVKGEGLTIKGHSLIFGGDGNYLYLDCGDSYMIIYICQKLWNCVHLKLYNVCQL